MVSNCSRQQKGKIRDSTERHFVLRSLICLSKSPSHSTLIILQKFLRANVDDLEKAKEQLTASLKWRKEYQPLKARDEAFDGEKFGKLGYITRVKGVKGSKNAEDVATFNIYGAAAKDFKKTFGDTDA